MTYHHTRPRVGSGRHAGDDRELPDRVCQPTTGLWPQPERRIHNTCRRETCTKLDSPRFGWPAGKRAVAVPSPLKPAGPAQTHLAIATYYLTVYLYLVRTLLERGVFCTFTSSTITKILTAQ